MSERDNCLVHIERLTDEKSFSLPPALVAGGRVGGGMTSLGPVQTVLCRILSLGEGVLGSVDHCKKFSVVFTGICRGWELVGGGLRGVR